VTSKIFQKCLIIVPKVWEVTHNVFHHPWHIYQMDFYHFFSSSKDFTFDFSMSHCYTRYRSEEISPIAFWDRAILYCYIGPRGPLTLHRSQSTLLYWLDSTCWYSVWERSKLVIYNNFQYYLLLWLHIYYAHHLLLRSSKCEIL